MKLVKGKKYIFKVGGVINPLKPEGDEIVTVVNPNLHGRVLVHSSKTERTFVMRKKNFKQCLSEGLLKEVTV